MFFFWAYSFQFLNTENCYLNYLSEQTLDNVVIIGSMYDKYGNKLMSYMRMVLKSNIHILDYVNEIGYETFYLVVELEDLLWRLYL